MANRDSRIRSNGEWETTSFGIVKLKMPFIRQRKRQAHQRSEKRKRKSQNDSATNSKTTETYMLTRRGFHMLSTAPTRQTKARQQSKEQQHMGVLRGARGSNDPLVCTQGPHKKHRISEGHFPPTTPAPLHRSHEVHWFPTFPAPFVERLLKIQR